MSDNVLKFRELGDPILKVVCSEVNISNISKEDRQTISDLKSTFDYANGLGIAAPQIGRIQRIIIIGVKKELCKYEDAEDVPIMIMINPVITYYSKSKIVDYEGCFSVPSIRGPVKRSKNIEVEYYNEKLEKQVWKVSGYTARLIQHEIDHLDGICFVQRVKDNSKLTTQENLNKFVKNRSSERYI